MASARGLVAGLVAGLALVGGWLGWSGSDQALRARPLEEALSQSRSLIARQLVEQAAAGQALKACDLGPGASAAATGEAFVGCWRSQLGSSGPRAEARLKEAKASARLMARQMGQESEAIALEIDKVAEASGSASTLGAAMFHAQALLRQTQAIAAGDQEGAARLAALARQEFESRRELLESQEALAEQVEAKLGRLSREAGLGPSRDGSQARKASFERLRENYWMTQHAQEVARAYARRDGAKAREVQARAKAWAKGRQTQA